MEKELNRQVQRELMSAYIYLGLVSYFEDLNYSGIAAYFSAAAKDELNHGMIFSKYIIDRSGKLQLDSIEKPPTDYDSPVAGFEAALRREREITEAINAIYKLAVDENDYATQVFLQDMVKEQVEEIKEASERLDHVKVCQDNPVAMIMFDRELARAAAGGH
jgi:ferritin